jgi:hypothetical protein
MSVGKLASLPMAKPDQYSPHLMKLYRLLYFTRILLKGRCDIRQSRQMKDSFRVFDNYCTLDLQSSFFRLVIPPPPSKLTSVFRTVILVQPACVDLCYLRQSPQSPLLLLLLLLRCFALVSQHVSHNCSLLLLPKVPRGCRSSPGRTDRQTDPLKVHPTSIDFNTAVFLPRPPTLPDTTARHRQTFCFLSAALESRQKKCTCRHACARLKNRVRINSTAEPWEYVSSRRSVGRGGRATSSSSPA